jgi:hypothetical protein
MLAFSLTAIPMAGRTPNLSSSNAPHSRHVRLGFCLY